MRICMHRGAEEIGGNCVELGQDRARILLDLGLLLDAENAVGAPQFAQRGCSVKEPDGRRTILCSD